MRSLTHTVSGGPVTVRFPETRADLVPFWDFVHGTRRVLAVDTETTGLDVFAPAHRLRLFQIGDDREAWVLDADRFAEEAAKVLRQRRKFVCHNASYDLQVFDRHLGVPIEALSDRMLDTRILAHLLDPRSRAEGGTGHALKDLAVVYVDPSAQDGQAALHALFRNMGETKATGWAAIPADDETFVRYAGLDVILTRRLLSQIGPMVREVGLESLATFEHHLQALVAIMERRGMRLDVPYTQRLKGDLLRDAEEARAVAARYGVANVNSTAQVAAALAGMGETLTEHTASGAVKVDKGVLLPLADLTLDWQRRGVRQPNPLAEAVLHAKRAAKWATSYAQAFLDLRDGQDRVHPSIGTLQARTARMSVSRPPLQQLPSKEHRIRRAFVADPGSVIVSVDYSQIEMRVLAALADEPTMKQAIASGVDLHDFTAERIYGPGFTKAQRSIAKGVGFGKVYGGGAATLSRQTGAPIDAVQAAIKAYDDTFPGIARYSRRLMRRAEYGAVEVITPAGRHLPLDRDRLYTATNYVVQSTARDVLAEAIVRLFDKGLGDFLLLPIHDEILAQAPASDAPDIAKEIAEVMGMDFYDVPIPAEAEVGGRSWGSLYGADE